MRFWVESAVVILAQHSGHLSAAVPARAGTGAKGRRNTHGSPPGRLVLWKFAFRVMDCQLIPGLQHAIENDQV